MSYYGVFFFFFLCIPSYISGFDRFWWDFCVCDRFKKKKKSNHRRGHSSRISDQKGVSQAWYIEEIRHSGWEPLIWSSWMVHAGCVFLAGIHLSRTWMSGSFGSVQWNACVHRLDVSLYSHLKEFLRNGVCTCLGQECQDLLSPCDGMHMCTD